MFWRLQGWGEDSIWGMSGAPILGALPEIQISMQSLRNLDGPHTRRSPACHADHFHRRETGAPLYYFCKHNICAQRLCQECAAMCIAGRLYFSPLRISQQLPLILAPPHGQQQHLWAYPAAEERRVHGWSPLVWVSPCLSGCPSL